MKKITGCKKGENIVYNNVIYDCRAVNLSLMANPNDHELIIDYAKELAIKRFKEMVNEL